MKTGGLVLLCIACVGNVLAQEPAPPTDDAAFDIKDDILIHTSTGGTLSALVVRPTGTAQRLPTYLVLDVYTDPVVHRARAKAAASHGYAGVIVDVRGKRLSPDPFVPYEHDAADSYDVIEWIVRQPWSDGKVAMRGGSFSGFSAWAATKRRHPALKTIAVSAAAIPGFGLPMQNNVFLNANYQWAFYVGNNKYLDNAANNDRQRWSRMQLDWFASGRPYREIDRVDGTPNPVLQRWLQHPAYDSYWQRMVPYGKDFAKIDIPVLTITGYYDDGQISALHYLKEHYRYRKDAEHYLVIGPYDHPGTHAARKQEQLRGYTVDPVAQFSTPELTLQWFDHVLRGAPRPALLTDRINYQVMGTNEWHHAASLASMAARKLKLYFSDVREADRYRLTGSAPTEPRFVEQQVDFRNRRVLHNYHSYPAPIVQGPLEYITETMFVSEPFEAPTIIAGTFTGTLDITINKKDVDLGVTVFELLPDGKLFHLGNYLGRASFAADPTDRHLLIPGRMTSIQFATSVIARRLNAGSRLLVLLDVNKNPVAQVNYGTGKDVSDESIADAGEPLQIRWHNSSFVNVPLERQGSDAPLLQRTRSSVAP